MNNELDINQLLKAAETMMRADSVGQEFMLGDVYRQTRAAYERFPEDTVIGQVAFTIEKMADNASPGTTISQAEISSIHNDLVRLSGSSKFRDVLGHLLPQERTEFSSKNNNYVDMNRIDSDSSGLTNEDLANQELVGVLQSVFDGSMNKLKAFDSDKAAQGKEYVKIELESLGYNKPNIEVIGGDTSTLVFAAHLDTRNGIVSVAIPINLGSDGGMLLPSTFVADDHLESLAGNNLQYFVDKKGEARDFSMPSATDVLSAVGIISGKSDISENEMTNVSSLFGEADQVAVTSPELFLDRKYEDSVVDIDTTVNVEMPKELAHLAKDFEDSVVEASSVYGKDAVRNGKGMVLAELKSAGFNQAQVRFGSDGDQSVFYTATIPTSAGPVDINVQVDMGVTAANTFAPMFPRHFSHNGKVEEFIPSTLQRFAADMPTGKSGSKLYQAAFAYMTLPELKDQMLSSVAQDDFVAAEAALNQISDTFSEEDHKNAFADFNFMLTQKANLASQATAARHTCNKIIEAGKGSIYERCGHFGIPLSQVVSDDKGNCTVKASIERSKLNPLSDGGAGISTSKLLLT